MSVTERDPVLVESGPTAPTGPGVPGEPELLLPREVPLGGPRAMLVQRSLPQRRRSLIGAWCFLDHYGPDDVSQRGMRVPGHPHTGLQTVTWLFEGEVEHRDTTGAVAVVRPGEMNLMTAGLGVAHSEYSTPGTTRVHGAQLWVALPDGAATGNRAFEHYVPPLLRVAGAEVRVFLGEWLGATGGPRTFTRLFGAEVVLRAGTEWRVPVDARDEIGVLVDRGVVAVEGVTTRRSQLVALPPGRTELELRAEPGEDARVLVLGGEPFASPIVMWWNFVGRDHDDIVRARADWQRQVDAAKAGEPADGRFGPHPASWGGTVLPAPELPTVRLKPRS
ncbi:MAG: quercetin 2,3-dioxygenase [Microbacteriaceae bacterium]|nr:quercetin 2,3-dioxygenase [Microbacteriaceae bacterium]